MHQKQPPEVFYRKGFLKNFHKIRRKTPVPEACKFIKKEALTQVFSCEICEISKNTYFTEHLWTNASEYPLDTGRKLNVHKMSKTRARRLLHVLCMFNVRPESRRQTVNYVLDHSVTH